MVRPTLTWQNLRCAVVKYFFSPRSVHRVGTRILIAGILSGFIMGCGPLKIAKIYGKTIWKVRFSMMTIACIL